MKIFGLHGKFKQKLHFFRQLFCACDDERHKKFHNTHRAFYHNLNKLPLDETGMCLPIAPAVLLHLNFRSFSFVGCLSAEKCEDLKVKNIMGKEIVDIVWRQLYPTDRTMNRTL